jgi:hypothetical protein
MIFDLRRVYYNEIRLRVGQFIKGYFYCLCFKECIK